MREKIQSFYLNRVTLLVSSIVSSICWIGWMIVSFVNGEYKLAVFGFIFFVCCLSLLLSYLKGDTNVQKMLFGAFLMFFIVDLVELEFVFTEFKVYPYLVISTIVLILTIVITICHMFQQNDKTGKTVAAIISQCLSLIILIWPILIILGIINNILTVSDVVFSLAASFSNLMVLCMETRINRYKQIRAEKRSKNEWDEKAKEEAKRIFKI